MSVHNGPSWLDLAYPGSSDLILYLVAVCLAGVALWWYSTRP